MNSNSLRILMNEYLNIDEFKDEEDIYLLKNTIINKLTPLQKNILLLYADEGSYRKVAKIVNCSQTQVMNIIKNIKKIILENYGKRQRIG